MLNTTGGTFHRHSDLVVVTTHGRTLPMPFLDDWENDFLGSTVADTALRTGDAALAAIAEAADTDEESYIAFLAAELPVDRAALVLLKRAIESTACNEPWVTRLNFSAQVQVPPSTWETKHDN